MKKTPHHTKDSLTVSYILQTPDLASLYLSTSLANLSLLQPQIINELCFTCWYTWKVFQDMTSFLTTTIWSN